MAIANVPDILNMLLSFIYTITDFTYNILFSSVDFGGYTFQLWQIFGVVGVGVFIVALIIKIIL